MWCAAPALESISCNSAPVRFRVGFSTPAVFIAALIAAVTPGCSSALATGRSAIASTFTTESAATSR